MNEAKEIINYMHAVNQMTESSEPQDNVLGRNGLGLDESHVFSLDHGTRWLQIVESDQYHFMIEHGYIDCEADQQEWIEKIHLAELVRDGTITIVNQRDNQKLQESHTHNDFDGWIDRVDRYLLVNYNLEHDQLEADWKDLYDQNLTPQEAADYAAM